MYYKKTLLVFAIFVIGLSLSTLKDVIAEITKEQETNKHFKEAIIAYNNGQFLKAIRAYKQLADHQDILGYLNLAVIFKDLGYYERAIRILEKASKKFPDDLRILLLLGRLYYLEHKIDGAISILKRVLEVDPNNIEANINLGLCYTEKGIDSEAEKYYQKAIALNKNNIVARISLASLYQRKDKIQEAVEEYRKISLIDASILSIQRILAELLFKLGNFEESLKIYRKILLREPQDKLIQARITEISDRLGKEYFEKENQRLALQRKQKKILVKPLPKILKVPLVRIGLMQEVDSVEFKCSTPFQIKPKSKQTEVFSGLEDEIYLISKSVDNKIIISSQKQENFIIDEPILVNPTKPEGTTTVFNVILGKDNFWMSQSDRSFRGTIEVNIDKNGLTVINIVNLEEYLYSVVPSEMPGNWPKEALKAQAITARTEAIKKLGRHKKEGFDFCAQVHCQVYSGVEQETEATTKAVDETRGLIMVYKDEPIDALYSSNCGGHTQDNIFGDNRETSYLKGRPDLLNEEEWNFPLSPLDFEYWLTQPPKEILCNNEEYPTNSAFRWVRIYNYNEMESMLARFADFGQLQKIIITGRNKSGHVTRLKIIGSDAVYLINKELNIRKALGNLRSSMFKIEVKRDSKGKPQQFIFYGGGFGHGVGMCQSGAKTMAEQGKTYKEILKHYFKDIEFKRLY